MTQFTPILDKIHKTDKTSYIVGDFNYNLINVNHDRVTQDYYGLLTNHMYRQTITKPTRITDKTATLIDHIWHNDMNNNTNRHSGVIFCDYSDHLPNYYITSKNQTALNKKVRVKYRQFTTHNFNNYRMKLQELRTE